MPVTHNETATKNTHPHSAVCDRPGCEWRTAHSEYDQAVRILDTHPCPHLTLKRTYMTGVMDERGVEYTPPNRGKSLAEKAWDMLDSKIDELMKRDFQGTESASVIQGWCQALCWTIHTWTPHWYPTPEHVKAEAAKRREIRLGNQEFSPTPGYQYNPMPPTHKDFARVNKQAYMPSELANEQAKATKKAASTGGQTIKPEDITLIKQAFEMFGDADEVARVLKIDINIVKSHI